MIRVILMCLFIVSSTHDIHFTKSTIDYNEQTQTLQVVMNVFTDDLELSIERTHEGLNLEIGGENQHEHTDSLVAAYLTDHIICKNVMQDVNFKFIGFEYDYDICYLYLESDTFSIKSYDEFYLSVPMFFEFFDDQENVVDLHLPQKDERFIFTKQSSSYTFPRTP